MKCKMSAQGKLDRKRKRAKRKGFHDKHYNEEGDVYMIGGILSNCF